MGPSFVYSPQPVSGNQAAHHYRAAVAMVDRQNARCRVVTRALLPVVKGCFRMPTRSPRLAAECRREFAAARVEDERTRCAELRNCWEVRWTHRARLYAYFTSSCGDWEAFAWIVRDLGPESGRMSAKVLDADLTSREAISIPHHESETQVSRKAPVHGLLGRADIEGLPVGVPPFAWEESHRDAIGAHFPLGGVEVWGYRGAQALTGRPVVGQR